MVSYEKVKREQINPWFLRQSIVDTVRLEQLLRDLIQQNNQEGLTLEEHYNECATVYALGSIRLLTFSFFFWIGKYYFPGWLVAGNSLVSLSANMAYFNRPENFNLIIYLLPIAEGVFHGAGASKLSIPTEPIISLSMIVTSVLLKFLAVKIPEENLILRLSVLFSVPLVLHILIGYFFGWLSYTYSFMSIAFCLASIIPFVIDISHFSIAHVIVPSVTMYSKFIVYWTCGVRIEP